METPVNNSNVCDEKTERIEDILRIYKKTFFERSEVKSRGYCRYNDIKQMKCPDFIGGVVVYKPKDYNPEYYRFDYLQEKSGDKQMNKNNREINKKNKEKVCRMLLVIGWREGKWNQPGGTIEESEDALDALHREFCEETGYPRTKARIFNEKDYLFTSETNFRENRSHKAHVFGKEINDREEFDRLINSKPENRNEIYAVVSVPICIERVKKGEKVLHHGFHKYFDGAFDTEMESVGREHVIWILYVLQVFSSKEVKYLYCNTQLSTVFL